jgi:hypothetical protein
MGTLQTAHHDIPPKAFTCPSKNTLPQNTSVHRWQKQDSQDWARGFGFWFGLVLVKVRADCAPVSGWKAWVAVGLDHGLGFIFENKHLYGHAIQANGLGALGTSQSLLTEACFLSQARDWFSQVGRHICRLPSDGLRTALKS